MRVKKRKPNKKIDEINTQKVIFKDLEIRKERIGPRHICIFHILTTGSATRGSPTLTGLITLQRGANHTEYP